jgi:hypothetical protein
MPLAEWVRFGLQGVLARINMRQPSFPTWDDQFKNALNQKNASRKEEKCRGER